MRVWLLEHLIQILIASLHKNGQDTRDDLGERSWVPDGKRRAAASRKRRSAGTLGIGASLLYPVIR